MTTAVLDRPAAGQAAPSPGVSDAEREWFADFYERTFGNALRFALMLTHDHFLAEDIVADAFARAWNARHTFNGTTELPWLLSIVRNRAVDHFRARRETVNLDAIPEPSDHESTPILELTPAQLRQLHRAIARLTDEQQQVIYLRFYEGLAHDVVARRLGKNANAVRAIQFRALSRLRALLGSADV
ncbi:MAG: sigma-70 family RNA polymerase sigma factor [Dehalococcoidia bacterium]|nr:sigma-70 family RNA polymerase sigma factor [Dehalococcoidia bacterium]